MRHTAALSQVILVLASSIGCLLASSAVRVAALTEADTEAEVASGGRNDTLMLEAVMSMYGATSVNGAWQLSKSQLSDIVHFGKNASRMAFMHQLHSRLHAIGWKDLLQCESAASLLQNNSAVASPDLVNGTAELQALLPRLLFAMQNPDCYIKKERSRSLSDPLAWLYSFLAVLVMKVCALAGILTFPCMSATVYTMALSFLVPLAISSLMGSTLFIFMPEILNLSEIPHYEENFGDPVLKMLVVGVGIYLFYLIEKLLRLLMEHKEKQFYKNSVLSRSYSLNIAEDNVTQKPTRKISTTMAGDISSFPRELIVTKRDSRVNLAAELPGNRASVMESGEKQQIAPIAWIAIMGDCIRNFIDGIAIGAAFSISPLVGLSLTLAFVFEEIPTELGDVAILLNAGMSICRATGYHFFAAVFAFVGAAAGILLGDLGQSQIWIFAISAGAFLYIALVDLMPEMNHALESDKAKGIGRMKIFLLQNVGLVLGFMVTTLLGLYKDSLHINFGDSSGGGGSGGH